MSGLVLRAVIFAAPTGAAGPAESGVEAEPRQDNELEQQPQAKDR